MSLTGHQRQNRGASDVWLTPRAIIDALGPFDLDPCAAPDPRPWATARVHYTEADDGLSLPWHGYVWCNPPFGPDAGKWLARLADHGDGIGLCAARTETRWFVEQVWQRADAILFLHGRPTFCHPDGTPGRNNSGAPICLVGYGSTAVDRLAAAPLAGTFLPLGKREWAVNIGGWPVPCTDEAAARWQLANEATAVAVLSRTVSVGPWVEEAAA